MSSAGYRKWQCKCDICKQYTSESRYYGKRGLCQICKRSDLALAPKLPDIVKSFLKADSICCYCLNAITNAVGVDWRLCWADASDDQLRWALCGWIRNHYWHDAFKMALKGLSSRGEYNEKNAWAAKEPRKPLRDEVACIECGRWFISHPNTLRCPKCKKKHLEDEKKRKREWNRAVRIVIKERL